jgi:hypothetical protein
MHTDKLRSDFGLEKYTYWNCSWKPHVSENSVTGLLKETNEILAMTVASIKTLRASRSANPKSKSKI